MRWRGCAWAWEWLWVRGAGLSAVPRGRELEVRVQFKRNTTEAVRRADGTYSSGSCAGKCKGACSIM